MTTAAQITLTNCEPAADDLAADVAVGLSRSPKTLACKWLYDRRGSELFDHICELPEYYPTRTEMSIMRGNARAICDKLGSNCLLIELGSGSSLKTRVLLDGLTRPAGYIPIDISREHLLLSSRRLAKLYPGLSIMPLCADYNQDFDLPYHHAAGESANDLGATGGLPTSALAGRVTGGQAASGTQPKTVHRVIYFPGSTIGNFHAADARRFLKRMARLVQSPKSIVPSQESKIPNPQSPIPNPQLGGLLIGVDLRKDPDILTAAYNDAQGVTAAFNLNLLDRINRETDADFNLDAFAHRAVWNDSMSRIEMHLVSLADQSVTIRDQRFDFQQDETIRTECSYKYTLDRFAHLAAQAGWKLDAAWTDADELFSVQYLTLG